jgi:hypothetical protein
VKVKYKTRNLKPERAGKAEAGLAIARHECGLAVGESSAHLRRACGGLARGQGMRNGQSGCRRSVSGGGYRPAAAAGPLLPTQPPPIIKGVNASPGKSDLIRPKNMKTHTRCGMRSGRGICARRWESRSVGLRWAWLDLKVLKKYFGMAIRLRCASAFAKATARQDDATGQPHGPFGGRKSGLEVIAGQRNQGKSNQIKPLFIFNHGVRAALADTDGHG